MIFTLGVFTVYFKKFVFLSTLNKFNVALPETHLSISSSAAINDSRAEGRQECRKEEEVIVGF